MTANNERQAEIEAVARALEDAEIGEFGETYRQAAVGILEALDRARDARHDDEAACANCGFAESQHVDACMEYMPGKATRSPQGEDHETVARALESVLGRIDTEEAAANAVEAVCRALGYRPDASTARDARPRTTTAEDVRAQTIAEIVAALHEYYGRRSVPGDNPAAFIEREFAPGDAPHPTDTAAGEQNADGG